jgi:hypothetical protein
MKTQFEKWCDESFQGEQRDWIDQGMHFLSVDELHEAWQRGWVAGQERFRKQVMELKDRFAMDLMDPDAQYILERMVAMVSELEGGKDDEV